MLERFHHEGGIVEIVLDEQHRMHPDLWDWPNRTFYDGRVCTGALAFQRRPVSGLPWTEPLAVVHVPGWGRKVVAVTCARS